LVCRYIDNCFKNTAIVAYRASINRLSTFSCPKFPLYLFNTCLNKELPAFVNIGDDDDDDDGDAILTCTRKLAIKPA